MLESRTTRGGSLLKFGGDALLLALRRDDHALRAAGGGSQMPAAAAATRSLPTSVGRLNLRMSVGVQRGLVSTFLRRRSHRELIVTGPAATQTTVMEQTADAGEIVVSAATARAAAARRR